MSKRIYNVATVFSGIGSPEFALHRMGVPYKLMFACDNGEIYLKESEENLLLLMEGQQFTKKRNCQRVYAS